MTGQDRCNLHKVLYFDTAGFVYVSCCGEHCIHPDTSGELGLCTSELPLNDRFLEFVSGGPKLMF